jgi:signal transduction histidine kinase
MAKSKTKDAALVLAELAHELRQPLTGIRASAELLREAHPDDPAVQARVETIVRQAERIQLLLERARRQGPPPPGARGDLNQAVESAWSLLEAEATRRGAALELRLAPVPAVSADQVALEQIFGNLLRNALEAVAVTTAPAAGGAEAIVEDDGPGVPAELRARLFSRLATGRAGGTGLGLYISVALAEEAGGALELMEGGGGARFRLRLPAAP